MNEKENQTKHLIIITWRLDHISYGIIKVSSHDTPKLKHVRNETDLIKENYCNILYQPS